MTLHLISVHHAEHGLAAVEAVTPQVAGLGRRLLADDAVRGAVVLATCNRVEVYVDADAPADHVAGRVRAALGDAEPHEGPLAVREDADALRHLFDVGAGLDSMVVGEREIAGQLRRALKAAHRDGTSSGLLTETIEQALRTSRKVAHLTRLATTGRSVVAVGLDMIAREWPATRVLLVGTGAYAGAVVAALRERGCADIAVHSSSGRAAAFAASHPGTRAASASLVEALRDTDVVLTCRGLGRPVLTAPLLAEATDGRAAPLAVLDLAVARDVDPAAGRLPGVLLVDLPTIQRHVPEASRREVGRARNLVDEGVKDLVTRLKGREMDPAVIALRDTVNAMVADEVARLPQGRPVTGEEAAHALRRLAARLVHVPSVRARKAAQEGRAEEYLSALSELWGIEPAVQPLLANLEVGGADERDVDAAVPPDTLDCDTCPITGLRLSDLGARPELEAM
ncbi:glutamyl-tRNA reductase [Propioniciclava coleopterorum]|uniref:Glutamyl-tRNA reductase n=1 Tax=Propioniciclava coleopterorum TaxID=2714937 RepID=A0A6G7Y801_9ACTN|nr:glutamyl-tRNA reductase [Propioniciclava coleopterorum]QIK72778.1 glutamyl-tRNA reductase [Propioniciclava coleopterorum]